MILAIVQARMSSTRCPGKTLKEVLGRPIISYLFERLSKSALIDKIVLATSTNGADDPLCDFVQSEGYDVCRGSEEDVLERFYTAAKPYKPDVVVRITGDCPCIDPVVADQLLQTFLDRKADYAELSQDYAEGADCEVFTFDALEESFHQTTMQSEREHVTLYINNNKDKFNTFLLPNATDDSSYRFTVDEPEDFVVVKSIFEALYKDKSQTFSLEDIKNFLDKNPEIYQMNNHIVRNEGLQISLENDEVMKSV